MQTHDTNAAESFYPHRSRLIRLAYRMVGTMADAEDIVQDAYLRWHRTDRSSVQEPVAFLSRIVTRLCLDFLKSARVQREQYIGPWLPEPVLDWHEEGEDGVTFALMLAMERLSPLERAAFLLHDVFGFSFNEVAQAIGRDSAACRQLAARARAHVRNSRPRFPVSAEQSQSIVDAFFTATRGGDLKALVSLLSENVVTYTDGGGKVPSAYRPVIGCDKVSRFFVGLHRKPGFHSRLLVAHCRIDGLPSFVSLEQGLVQTTSLLIEEGVISAIYIVRNPDKLPADIISLSSV